MEKIEREVDELVELIKDEVEYKKYCQLVKLIDNNDEINNLINDIKSLQQRAVNEEYRKNYKETKKIDRILTQKQKLLRSIPLYNEYLYSCEDLDELMTTIKSEMQRYFDNLDL
jgi:cell fate (sporulation/competence/biofilm development) regulator YmcA (YheA/YmcA/DUF963 family)